PKNFQFIVGPSKANKCTINASGRKEQQRGRMLLFLHRPMFTLRRGPIPLFARGTRRSGMLDLSEGLRASSFLFLSRSIIRRKSKKPGLPRESWLFIEEALPFQDRLPTSSSYPPC